MTTRHDCKATMRADLRKLAFWNWVMLVLALASLGILGAACVALYHFPQ